MSINGAQIDISREMKVFEALTKLHKKVSNSGKKVLPQALKSCPKCVKSPNLVTLLTTPKICLLCSQPKKWGLNNPEKGAFNLQLSLFACLACQMLCKMTMMTKMS